MSASDDSTRQKPAAHARPVRILLAARLEPGMRDRVRELIRGGPPFDPEEASLALHEVFLLEDEVLFLFETAEPDAVGSLVEAWAGREPTAGGARLADCVYSWTRTGRSAAPAPHPGLGF